jgi:ATP:corrinoid adenosyltransferase
MDHSERMQKKKAVIDKHIAEANAERGVFLINTGNGKGKSSAAFGLLARALGHGMKAVVVQFIKNRSDTGEEFPARRAERRLACDGRGLHLGNAGQRCGRRCRARRLPGPGRRWPTRR